MTEIEGTLRGTPEPALPNWKLGTRSLLPIVQGGMGVGVSAHRLAGTVAGLGGVGTIPWRAPEAEEVLRGAPIGAQVFRAAADAAVHDPFTVPGTAFKVELAKHTLVRILETVTEGSA